MAYTLQEQYDAVNYTPEDQVANTWGMGPRTYDFITIHWWGNPVGQSLYSIIAWFCGLLPVTAGTSAHYVVSGKIAACIVSIQNAAWHAGGKHSGKHGNVSSVGLELDPKADADTYETAGELIADIWIQIGKKVPLVSHSYWTATTCPGSYDLSKLTAIANKWYAVKTGPTKPTTTKPTPIPSKGALMALTDKEQTELLSKVRELHRDYIQGVPGRNSDGDSFSVLRSILAAVKGKPIDEAARKKKVTGK